MFISKLTLKNWRSHYNSTFTFGKINLIRGANNVGKSSVAQAIEYALTGRCPGTDERGAGADSLISRRKEAKAATVILETTVNGGLPGILTRTRTYKGTSFEIQAGDQILAGRAAEDADYFIDKNLISAALRAGRFLELSKDAQAELLGDLLRPDPVAVPEEIRAAIAACERTPLAAVSLEGARNLEEASIKLRAECTAALRELGEPVEVPEKIGFASALQCQGKLDELRREQNKYVRDREGLLIRWQNRQQTARAALERLPQAKAETLSLKDEAALMESLEKKDEVHKAQETLSRLRFEVSELEGEIKNAERKGGKCPTCGHEVETEDLVKRYREGIAARQSRIPSLELLIEKYPPMHTLEAKIRIHRDAVAEVLRLEKLLSEAPADEPQPDTSELDAQIAQLEARIQKGQEVVAETAKYEADRKHYLAQVEKKAALEAKREAADKVAKWASPTGVQAEMTGDKIGAFKSAVNEVLQPLGYDVQMEPSIGVILVGRFPIGTQFRPSELSESEQWRFSVAFQVAIAKVSGLGFVVLDRADVLVGENRAKLMEAVATAGLEQVFILASVDRKAEMPPEVTVFDLELKDGQTIIERG
jgi:DNA repair exonuclease SbcCD ATPase subunit